jgi:hypothetical protein
MSAWEGGGLLLDIKGVVPQETLTDINRIEPTDLTYLTDLFNPYIYGDDSGISEGMEERVKE